MNRYYSKIAGEDDALSAFGLSHGTPRPPPTWAQEWLEGARKNGTKNITIPSMREKKAFEPITMGLGAMGLKALLGGLAGKAAITAGTGAGLHVGSNLFQKALQRFAPNLGKKQFASGLAHGMEGRRMHPILDSAVRLGAGPEYLAQYEMGQETAKQLAGLSPANREARLRQLGSAIGESKNLSKAPIAGDVPGGIDRYQKGEHGFVHKHLLKTVPQDAVTPGWQKAVAPAAAIGASILQPHVAPQFIVNAVRDRVAKSSVGRKYMANELAQGGRGVDVSPARKRLTDLLISPAANAPREIGLAANKDYGELQGRVNQWAGEHGHGPVALPNQQQVVDYAEGVHNRLQAPAAPGPTAPAPEHNGNLTKALLGGAGLYTLNNALRGDDSKR